MCIPYTCNCDSLRIHEKFPSNKQNCMQYFGGVTRNERPANISKAFFSRFFIYLLGAKQDNSFQKFASTATRKQLQCELCRVMLANILWKSLTKLLLRRKVTSKCRWLKLENIKYLKISIYKIMTKSFAIYNLIFCYNY